MNVESDVHSEFAVIAVTGSQQTVSVVDRLTEALFKVLPQPAELSSAVAKHLLGYGIEIVPMIRAQRRLWLESDWKGPGYQRTSLYARLTISHDHAEMVCEGDAKAIQDLLNEQAKIIREYAQWIGGAVSTFRAYNKLTDNDVVTVRPLGPLLSHLRRRGESGIAMRVDEMTDSYSCRMGGYFAVCPPGAEYVGDIEGERT